MPKVKTEILAGKALDWAVAWCEEKGKSNRAAPAFLDTFKPSTDWSQGGPILEREVISLNNNPSIYFEVAEDHKWVATYDDLRRPQVGSTMLIAGMRCYVATTLGTEVDIPETLLEGLQL